MTNYSTLREANRARQAEWCPDQKPDLSFRGNELGGEVGEAQNVIKKLERERHGWRGSTATIDDLADELADAVIVIDLIADQAGIDLGRAVALKFNTTSEKYNLDARMTWTVADAHFAPTVSVMTKALTRALAERDFALYQLHHGDVSACGLHFPDDGTQYCIGTDSAKLKAAKRLREAGLAVIEVSPSGPLVSWVQGRMAYHPKALGDD